MNTFAPAGAEVTASVPRTAGTSVGGDGLSLDEPAADDCAARESVTVPEAGDALRDLDEAAENDEPDEASQPGV